MVDAGTIGAALTLEEQRRITHVLLSHLHFDHVQGLPTLADNLVDDGASPVTIVGTTQVLNGLRSHLFNNKVYPNFFRLPTPKQPIFRLQAMTPKRTVAVGKLEVTPIRVNHLVPTVGFLVKQGESSFIYSGDTYETDEIWRVAEREPTLKAVFIESSFPDEQADLARVSRHLTPTLLARAFRKIRRPDLPLYVYHVKPRFREQIVQQLSRFQIPRLTVLEEGQEICL
ncbi:MAG: hypothetical protein A4S17_01320 [Proteobacteria bacterium HN_bin10]|nr:MAG: hypothetical protein A4S17_01320 [Proteobacteria bacterium HN_bin10]